MSKKPALKRKTTHFSGGSPDTYKNPRHARRRFKSVSERGRRKGRK